MNRRSQCICTDNEKKWCIHQLEPFNEKQNEYFLNGPVNEAEINQMRILYVKWNAFFPVGRIL